MLRPLPRVPTQGKPCCVRSTGPPQRHSMVRPCEAGKSWRRSATMLLDVGPVVEVRRDDAAGEAELPAAAAEDQPVADRTLPVVHGRAPVRERPPALPAHLVEDRGGGRRRHHVRGDDEDGPPQLGDLGHPGAAGEDDLLGRHAAGGGLDDGRRRAAQARHGARLEDAHAGLDGEPAQALREQRRLHAAGGLEHDAAERPRRAARRPRGLGVEELDVPRGAVPLALGVLLLEARHLRLGERDGDAPVQREVAVDPAIGDRARDLAHARHRLLEEPAGTLRAEQPDE